MTGILIGALALAAAVSAPTPPAPDELAPLRRAVLEAPGFPGAEDPVEVAAAWLAADESIPPEERDALLARIRTDPGLRVAITELASRRLLWKSARRGPFLAWWDPRQRDETGAPSSGLSDEDAAVLGDLLARTCEEQGIAVPADVPYVLDLEANEGRVRARSDLRWGVVTPSRRDRRAVVELALLELGDAAFVVEPLSALRACESRACRRDLLDEARRTIIRSGYVPILENLGASAFADSGDPGLASALLAIDHVDRLHPARTFGALLRTCSPSAGPKALRRAFFEATGEAPSALDRLVQAELADWARHGP